MRNPSVDHVLNPRPACEHHDLFLFSYCTRAFPEHGFKIRFRNSPEIDESISEPVQITDAATVTKVAASSSRSASRSRSIVVALSIRFELKQPRLSRAL